MSTVMNTVMNAVQTIPVGATQRTRQTKLPESLLVVGAGSAGCRHLTNARALGVRNLSVFRTGAGEPPDSLPGDVRVETDLERALSRGVEAVIIANPTALHLSAALQAANAGCHILIEKPLSHELVGIRSLQNAVERRGLTALVGYQFRFHPGLRHVRAWLQGDAIGEVVSAHARWGEYLPGWQPWRDYRTSYSARTDLGGGVVLTLSHPADYLRWLLGDVTRVSAIVSRRSGLDLDVEDVAAIGLEFERGALASLALDFVQQPPEHSLTIVGRKGIIRWNNEDGSATLSIAGSPLVRSAGRLPSWDRNPLFISELKHFFACIADEEEPVCSLEDGESAVRICLAAKQSAIEGRSVNV